MLGGAVRGGGGGGDRREARLREGGAGRCERWVGWRGRLSWQLVEEREGGGQVLAPFYVFSKGLTTATCSPGPVRLLVRLLPPRRSARRSATQPRGPSAPPDRARARPGQPQRAEWQSPSAVRPTLSEIDNRPVANACPAVGQIQDQPTTSRALVPLVCDQISRPPRLRRASRGARVAGSHRRRDESGARTRAARAAAGPINSRPFVA